MEKENLVKEKKIFQIFTYFCLALSLVSTISYTIYVILSSSSVLDQIISIISVFVLAAFAFLYVIIGMSNNSTKFKIFIIIGSLFLSFYSIFQIIGGIYYSDVVLDFTDMDIKDVVNWASDKNIIIEQEWENSDNIAKYLVIRQDVKSGINIKKVKKIKVVVSDGASNIKETEVTNMVGWKLDDVISFIDENHLTNVTINYEFNDKVDKDIIFEQNVIAVIKRNEPVTLKSSLGKKSELKSVTVNNLVGKDLFHALVYLGRNNIKYRIEYAYSDDNEDIVLKQSVPALTVISPNEDTTLILTVSRKDNITVLDLSNMSVSEINSWATNNRIKVDFSYEYDENVKKDKVVSFLPGKGNSIKVDSTIKVVVSKGQIYMINFTNVEDFIEWAEDNDIAYVIDYSFSNDIEKGQIVSSTHSSGQIIKNNETVKLVISRGSSTIVPNLMEMTKSEATDSCNKAKITCKFIYLDDNQSFDIVTKQSMRSGSNVPVNTTVTVTLGK